MFFIIKQQKKHKKEITREDPYSTTNLGRETEVGFQGSFNGMLGLWMNFINKLKKWGRKGAKPNIL